MSTKMEHLHPRPSEPSAAIDTAVMLQAAQQELAQLRSRYGEAEYMLLEKDRAIMELRATVRQQAPLVEKALAMQTKLAEAPPPPATTVPPPPAI